MVIDFGSVFPRAAPNRPILQLTISARKAVPEGTGKALDGVTAHLDPVTERAALEALREFISIRTAIIAHRRSVLANCWRVITLPGKTDAAPPI